VLFGPDRASEHLQRGVSLADVTIDDDRLFISMNPYSAILDHLFALGRICKTFFDSFENLRLLDPALFLSPGILADR
jgi:hypothetical protein